MKPDIVHPALGCLKFDADLNWYEGATETSGTQVPFYLSLDSGDEKTIVALARKLVPKITQLIPTAKDSAATSLLSLKNGGWLEDGESEFTHDGFVEHLSIESIIIYPDETAELIFCDGGLFFGHVVLVSVSADGQCSEASIAG
jgi:hypothetical protein